jgi:hypothetical protein
MEIIDGFIAVLLPFMVAICPKEDHWVVKIYDSTKATPDNREAAATLHDEPSADAAKVWASQQIAKLMSEEDKLNWGLDTDSESPALPWESLVCNSPV